MNRTDIAYLINTTPKYFYMLPLHLSLLQRYAPELKWPIFLATEEPGHPDILKLKECFPSLNIIPLKQEEEPFWESRLAATRRLPESIQYVFPIQEDFLLEGRPVAAVLEEAVELLDTNDSVDSLRLMPCPGPAGRETFGETRWRVLSSAFDEYVFTYQATLWRRETYINFFKNLIIAIPSTLLTNKHKVEIQIKQNIAERPVGQDILTRVSRLHLAWPREGSWPNAVYLAPWPYRPTAIVQGKIQQWARDLSEREGVPLAASASS
jgi:hypothetical protein